MGFVGRKDRRAVGTTMQKGRQTPFTVVVDAAPLERPCSPCRLYADDPSHQQRCGTAQGGFSAATCRTTINYTTAQWATRWTTAYRAASQSNPEKILAFA